MRDVLSVGLSPDKLLRLLLATAQLEFKLSELLKSLLATKQVYQGLSYLFGFRERVDGFGVEE